MILSRVTITVIPEVWFGRADEYVRLALTMIESDYFNREDVRLDGAIRMAPR